MTNDQKLAQIVLSLRVYNLGDIKKARNADSNLGAFILCSCFIDHLSRYRYYNSIKTDKQRFIAFTDHYLPSFKGKGADLYYSLRSSLVHNYSTKGRYLLAWGDRSVHMKEVGNQGTYIDLDELVLELELALNSYWADLLANPHIQHLAIAHYDAYPILAQVS